MFETWWEGKGSAQGDGERPSSANTLERPLEESCPQDPAFGTHDDSADFEMTDPTLNRWRARLAQAAKVTLGLGVGGTALALGATWGSRTYVQERLIPQVETTLSERLNRRVDLGDLSYVWPWQVTLRNSSIENLANIQAVDLSVDVPHWIRTREVVVNATVRQPSILLMETLDRGWTDLQMSPGDDEGGGIPISQINLSIVDGQLTALPLSQERYIFNDFQAQAQLDLTRLGSQDPDAAFTPDLQWRVSAQLDDQPLRVRGELDLLKTELQVEGSAQRLDLALLPSFLPILPIEEVEGQAEVSWMLGWQPQQPVDLQLQADVVAPVLDLAGVPLPFGDVRGQLDLDLAQGSLFLTDVGALYGRIPFQASGPIRFGDEDPGYGIQGHIDRLALEDLLATFELDLPVEVGALLSGSLFLTGELDDPLLGGSVSGVGSGRVDLPGGQERLLFSDAEVDFVLAGSNLDFNNIRLQSAGGSVMGRGQVLLGQDPVTRFELQGQDLDPQLIAGLYGEAGIPYDVGRLDAQTTVDIVAGGSPVVGTDFTLRGGEIVGTGRVEVASEQVRLTRSVFEVAGGRLAATADILDGQIQGILSPRELDLQTFGLEGSLSGDVSVQVPLDELNLQGLRAQGSLQLPQGAAGVPLPISSRLAWDGTGVQIESGSLGGLAQLSGRIPVDPQALTVGALDLRIQAEDVDITQLPEIEIPEALQARGRVDVDARLTGLPTALALQGDLALTGFGARDLEFERVQGSLFWAVGQGGQVDLQGQGDQIIASISPDLNEIDFQLTQGSITATGSRRGSLLQAALNDVPMEVLTRGAPGVTGRASGTVVVNLDQDLAEAQVGIEGLQLGDLEARQVSIELRFQDDQLQIPSASLQLFDSVYTLTGNIDLSTLGEGESLPQLNLNLATNNGSLEDIVATFKWQTWDDITSRGFRLPDLGPATAILAQPQGDPNAPLSRQLELYTEVVAALEQQLAQQTDTLLPQPPALSGTFQTQITLQGSPNQLDVSLQLDGQNWRAEEFQIDTVAILGSFDDDQFDLKQLDLTSGERSARFQGQLSLAAQQGSLQLEQIPLQTFSRFWPDGVALAGDLDAQVDLMGNLRDPQVDGRITLSDLVFNQVPIQQAGATLAYDAGTLTLDSTILADVEDPPIRIAGTVPLAPGFTLAAQERAQNGSSPQIDLNLEVPGEGLRLVNLFTDQVTWESGESDLRLVVQGTLQEPTMQGSLTLNEGILQVAALPDPITNITGQVLFDLDRLEVEQLTAFYGQGSLVLEGILPINTRGAQSLDSEGYRPLNLGLNSLNVVVPNASGTGDRLNTQVNGSVRVGGLLLRPLLLGHIAVTDGTLDLRGSTDPDPDSLVPALTPQDIPTWMPRFEDLRLAIGPRIEVRQGQLFHFDTSGELRLFGSPQQPQLAGSLTLDGGRLNLPLANFRIDRSQPNRVTFDLDNDLDPMLDLHLTTRATEVTRTGQLRGVGSQQSIEIQARVEGRASEISLNDPRPGIVSLSSIPARSEDEIFGILGSNVFATLGTSAGVAGFAGQELINTFEDILTDNLGIDEIRIGPLPIVTGTGIQSLGLGVEVARDLGPDISISAQQIFTNPVQPTRFGARYRISPNLLLRLSTDMNGSSAAALEFETRF